MPDIEPPEVPPLLNPSTAIPCANVSKDCLPCDDDPIANFTAEGPDSDRFLFIFRAHVIPPLGVVPGDVDRPGICYSETSQQDAEDCARQDAEEALVDQPVYRNVSIFHNTVQSCTGTCKDGTPFTYTVPAGTVVAFTQLEADQRAMGLACQRARTNRVCILTTALNTGCTGSAYSMTLKGLGGTPFVVSWYTLPFFDECIGEIEIGSEFPYVWFITHGELPDGLTLHSCSGVIDGTPTEIGDFPITIRATDATGAYLEKNFTLRVAEITNDSPLADGSAGAAYLVNFSTSIGDQEQQTWTVVSGSLPAGLTLSTAGVLSGTPTTDGVSNFTIKVVETGSSGFTCEKAFSLTVIGCPEAGTTSWNCPVDTAEKRIVMIEGDPSYPTYINSIDRVIVPASDGINTFSVINFNPGVPIIESTIPAGVAGLNPIITGEQFYDQPTDQIIALIRTGAVSPFTFRVCFYKPSDGSLNGSILLGTATFSGRIGSNFCAINKTGKVGLSIVLNNTQSFDDLYIIDPTTRTVVTSRQMPVPAQVPENYSLCYACDLRQLLVVVRASDTIHKFNDEDLTLEDTFSIGDNIDAINYIDSTGRIWAYSSDVIPRFVDVVNPSTGIIENTFDVGEGNLRGHPVYNLVLDSWIIGMADIDGGIDNGLWFYNVHTFARTCDIRRDWDQAAEDDEMGFMGYDSDNGTVYTHTITGAFHCEKVTPT